MFLKKIKPEVHVIIIFPPSFQTWADAFRGTPELKEIDKVYQDLKAKGIEFPMTDLDHMAPIHTPARVSHSKSHRTILFSNIQLQKLWFSTF